MNYVTMQNGNNYQRLWTVYDIRSAISQGDLTTIEQILADRDARGVPRTSLTWGDTTALMVAIWANPINEDIVAILLDTRDNEGYPLIDLNLPGPHGQTALSFILNLDDPILRRRLLQRVLDTRGPQGELLVDVRTDGSNITLLKKAVGKNDINCLNILLDARLPNGERALNVNQISHRTTVLDLALRRDDPWYRYNQAIVDTLRAAGGLEARQVTPIGLPIRREPPPVRRMPQEPIPNEGLQQIPINDTAARFNRDRQNTHNPTVAGTAKGSLNALQARYDNSETGEEAIRMAITQLVNSFDYTQLTIDPSLTTRQKQELALSCWRLVQSRFTQMHTATDLTIQQVLSYVWQAVVDDRIEVYPEDIRHTFDPRSVTAPGHLIELKKASFIEKLIEASRTYDNNIDICVGGLIHKLLEVLNHGHIDVTLCMGQDSVTAAVNQVPAAIAKRELENKPVREQRKILSSWNKAGGECAVAQAFRMSLEQPIRDAIQRQFGTLVSQEQIQRTVGGDALDYIGQPVMHVQLAELARAIKEILEDPTNDLLAKLKQRAEGIYDECDRTFQEEFSELHRVVIAYLITSPPEATTKELAQQIKYTHPDQIPLLGEHQIPHLADNQIPLLQAHQVSHVPQDKLQYLASSECIKAVSRWNLLYLKSTQLQYRVDLGRYIVMTLTGGSILGAVSLVGSLAIPILRIFSKTKADRTANFLRQNRARLPHLFQHVIPAAYRTTTRTA